MTAFVSPPLRAISPNSMPALNRQRDHSACGHSETPLKVRKTRENLRDTRAYPNIPPPCTHGSSHVVSSEAEVVASLSGTTLPTHCSEDVSDSAVPAPLEPSPTPQRRKSVSRRVLSRMKQGIGARSRANLSARPIESETSLIRRLSGKRKQSLEHEGRCQNFEISRDSIATTPEEDLDYYTSSTGTSTRSCTASTVSTSQLMGEVLALSPPIYVGPMPAPCVARPMSPIRVEHTDCSASEATPRPLPRVKSPSPPQMTPLLVPYVRLELSSDHWELDADHDHSVWVAIEAMVLAQTLPLTVGHSPAWTCSAATPPGGHSVGRITTLRLCYKPVCGCTITELIGQKALKDVKIGQTCTLFARIHVPRVQANATMDADSESLLNELESIVGTLETEVLHVEVRYRTSFLPHDNVVTAKQVARVRRPQANSRWSAVSAYNESDQAEQMRTKLAIYLADNYPPDRALKNIDKYLRADASLEEPIRQIRARLSDDLNILSIGVGDGRPAVIVTDVDRAETASLPIPEHFTTAPCTPTKAGEEAQPVISAQVSSQAARGRVRSISTSAMASLQADVATAMQTSATCANVTSLPDVTPLPDLDVCATQDDARRLWHHIRRSSLSSRQLAEMTPPQLAMLEAGDETVQALRKQALANKRSVGAETLREWRWTEQMARTGESPWM